ncbi:TPA: hypothetical protein DEG21_03455 [Patescibacteria group bacterium]|nr:hypothetical protein [Candidatus Gracilibacteria bacterium]
MTYTGNATSITVNHSLGIEPGMIIVKRTDIASDWVVYHRTQTNDGFLNYPNPFASAQRFSSVTSSDFTINVSTADVNASNGTYVAYVFAHDTSADGIIQAGSFITDANGNASVNLGWEPQYMMYKSATSSTNWFMVDMMRSWPNGGYRNDLFANLNNAEDNGNGRGYPTATGVQFPNGSMQTSQTYIYLAIRRPNKPPTSGTQVYNSDIASSNGTYTADAGFPVDLSIFTDRIGTAYSGIFADRLRGGKRLNSGTSNIETDSNDRFDNNSQFYIAGALGDFSDWINWSFRRAP